MFIILRIFHGSIFENNSGNIIWNVFAEGIKKFRISQQFLQEIWLNNALELQGQTTVSTKRCYRKCDGTKPKHNIHLHCIPLCS